MVGRRRRTGGWLVPRLVIERYLAGTLFEASGDDLYVDREGIGVIDEELLVRGPRVGFARDMTGWPARTG